MDSANTDETTLQYFITLPRRVLGSVALVIPEGYVMQSVAAGDEEHEDQVVHVFIRKAA